MSQKTRPEKLLQLRPSDILFEDADLIAVNKPSGWPSQGTLDPARDHLFAAVGRFISERSTAEKKSAGEFYVGLHHRLDAPTSGVLVFSKSRRANKGLAEQISEHKIAKIYWAIARHDHLKKVESDWEVRNYLKKAAKMKSQAAMTAVKSGGDPAQTSFSILERMSPYLLIEARPKTGRMHQIRVHLNDCGLPILGDPLYASPFIMRLAPRLMLHAREMRIQHPITNKELVFIAPTPDDFNSCWQAILKPSAREPIG